ncbi:3-keto-disaccharide hydrolase [Stratiformator vulcanicus]|uniref:3-keto-alpha-glucoside-1,2-lyase/3-keto-2-hydroxy-glucal hydratase domain-containing protein n=1 Tax=Stratiformator vulcanicus TaxID=2527980 RepID=A0A517QYA0_9PLAN|nr:DUF1080 domain-containing protein [Stratiformator vulcanicus]QDT36617.1 hypothetical protein Pan189_09770 [Stratiformator vulcanicus]
MRSISTIAATLLALVSFGSFAAAGEWTSLFDGKSFDGWKASENSDSWTIEDGAFKCSGPRSHLFYVGDEKPWDDFEFRCKAKTTKGSNSGIYFHTDYQESGWPKGGFEAQVNNTGSDPKKTGSLYAVQNVMEAPANDNEWFDYHIKVDGRDITISINGEAVTEYTEPEGTKPGKRFERALSEGTFAFQAHDPKSVAYFKDIEVKRLD